MLSGVLCFGLGMALQAAVMLRGSFRRGDQGRAGMALLVGLAGMIPGRREHHYDLAMHVFLSLMVVAVAFAYGFRDRLLIRIGGRLLLAWNLLLIFVALRAGWTSWPALSLLAIPTVPTVVNAFTDIDRAFGWKVFFHAWFSTILVVMAIAGFDAGPLGMFFHGPASVARPPLEIIASGAASLYIVTNAWFVLALTPVAGRHQPWRERLEEIRRHSQLLASGYVWEKDDPLRSLAVLVGLPLLLWVAARWATGSIGAIVSLAIAVMPLLAGRASDPDGNAALHARAHPARAAR